MIKLNNGKFNLLAIDIIYLAAFFHALRVNNLRFEKIMKILFLTTHTPDYLESMLYHGFCSIRGEIYSNADFWYLFKTADPQQIKKLYGKGFGYTGLIDGSQNKLSSNKIFKLIGVRYFDLIVFSQANKTLRYHMFVKLFYPVNRILYLDGEDDNYDSISIHEFLSLLSSSLYHFKLHAKIKMLININIKFRKKGKYYFKREINRNPYRFSPISFSIPKENIKDDSQNSKTKFLASLIPGFKETYIYDDQLSYFGEYQNSKYAITFKKGGWDCFRHYEILANGCIPIFPDLVSCPELTLFCFPKKLVQEINNKLTISDLDSKDYSFYRRALLDYTKQFLTTDSMAIYVLKTIGYYHD